MEIDNGLPLPILQPEITGDQTVMLIDPCHTAPATDKTCCRQSRSSQLTYLRGNEVQLAVLTNKIYHFIPHLRNNPGNSLYA